VIADLLEVLNLLLVLLRLRPRKKQYLQ